MAQHDYKNTKMTGQMTSKKQFMIYLFFLVFAYLCTVGVRYHQHIEVMHSPVHHAGSEVILTTQDSYRWLRFASEADSYTSVIDKLSSAERPPYLPLISRFTAMLSHASGLDLPASGSLLTVFLSGLFIFPLGLIFWLYGLPIAGLSAGLMGGLSYAYLSRTSAFQIDTDMLNLFFVCAGALFLVLAERGRVLLWSALLGLCMYVFWRWYFHSGFTVIYFVLLLFALRKQDGKTVLKASLLFIACASPFVFLNGFKGVYEFLFGVGGVSSFADVAELQKMAPHQVFEMVTPYWLFAVFGLAMSLLLKEKMVPLIVLYLLGVMVFMKGVRFGMYLAPVCGIGIGFALDHRIKDGLKPVGYALVTALMVLFLLKPYMGKIPPPVVTADYYTGIEKLRATEPNALVAGLWDNGFLVEYLAGRGMVVDGASQYKPDAKAYAQALFSDDEHESAQILRSVSDGRPMYLLFTPDMDKKLGSIIKTAGLKVAGEIKDNEVTLDAVDGKIGDKGVDLFETTYFNLHAIGLSDMECFKPYYAGNQAFSIYRVDFSCLKNGNNG